MDDHDHDHHDEYEEEGRASHLMMKARATTTRMQSHRLWLIEVADVVAMAIVLVIVSSSVYAPS